MLKGKIDIILRKMSSLESDDVTFLKDLVKEKWAIETNRNDELAINLKDLTDELSALKEQLRYS